MENKYLDKKEARTIRKNIKQSTETLTTKQYTSANCIVTLSRTLGELKTMQIKLKQQQQQQQEL